MPAVKDRIKPHLEDAWLGDAVLELYARSWILRQYGKVDADLKSRFTSNQFLNSLGQPTMVEAEVGRVYKEQGLEGAFAHIQAKIEPLFVKQEGKRQRSQR
ncbi:ribonuclease III domain-containing protein [Verrucomicrobium spinosum]|uniref:ribonuclease III domain-containing protein n=1 Tax=Verrucomicrobium spinosum TaxID=2736 RepID=UPI0001745667|nr:ribonuclease III domain-containing protein [Verrucomicrobium spinosum]